jgi:hypothetical protein
MRTQYRLKMGIPQRILIAEEDLLIVLDDDGLVMMVKEPELYRREVTARLRSAFAEECFCSSKSARQQNKE